MGRLVGLVGRQTIVLVVIASCSLNLFYAPLWLPPTPKWAYKHIKILATVATFNGAMGLESIFLNKI